MAKRAATPSDEEGDFTPSSPETGVASTSKTAEHEPASKKAKTNGAAATASSKSVIQIMSMSESALKTSTKDQLVQNVLALQAAAQNSQGTAGNAAPTKEEIYRKAQMYRETIAKGIQKQMAWKPSCKTGGARFSYEVIVPSRVQMLLALGRPEDEKPWKQKKVSIEALEAALGGMSVSIRYGYLSLSNNNKDAEKNPECIMLRYDDDGKLTISGAYGV